MKSKGKYNLPHKLLKPHCPKCKLIINWYEDKLYRYEKSISNLGLKIKKLYNKKEI